MSTSKIRLHTSIRVWFMNYASMCRNYRGSIRIIQVDHREFICIFLERRWRRPRDLMSERSCFNFYFEAEPCWRCWRMRVLFIWSVCLAFCFYCIRCYLCVFVSLVGVMGALFGLVIVFDLSFRPFLLILPALLVFPALFAFPALLVPSGLLLLKLLLYLLCLPIHNQLYQIVKNWSILRLFRLKNEVASTLDTLLVTLPKP